ncbi:tetratricopeptide repeat protein [Maricaulis sp. CAU 1757]
MHDFGMAIASLTLATASMQSAATPQLLDQAVTAYNAGDTETALLRAEEAVAAAGNPQDQYDAFLLYGDLRADIGDAAAAFEIYQRAREVVETHAPDNASVLEAVLDRMSGQAMVLGRRDDMQALAEESLALNRGRYELGWRFENEQRVRHRASAMPCPVNANNYVRTDLTNYNAWNTDVACRYTRVEEMAPVITVHAYLTNMSQEEAFAGSLQSMLENVSSGHEVDRGEALVADRPVHFAIYRQQGTTAGMWIHQVGDWTLKLRITHYGELSRNDMHDAADFVFAGAADVERHLDHCAALGGSGEWAGSSGASEALGWSVIAASAPVEPDTDALTCHIGAADFRPEGGYVVARISDTGDLVDYRAYPRGDGSTHLRASRDTRAIIRMAQAAETDGAIEAVEDLAVDSPWILQEVGPDGSGLYGSYTGMPSPATFASTVDQVLRGDIELQSWIEVSEDGNLNITLPGEGPEN